MSPEAQSLFLQTNIKDIVRRIASGVLSPIDVAEEAIRCIASANIPHQTFTSHDAEFLRNDARTVDARLRRGEPIRMLEAIPVGIKDTINTIEYPRQTQNSLGHKEFMPGNDARVVFNLRRQGTLVAGKTAVETFAAYALDEAEHPYNAAYAVEEPSCGGAAAVAAGMVPLAVGSQTVDSIVRSAGRCGVFGCKPSFGLIPRTGIVKMVDTLDTVGFFTAHAEDLVPAFDALRVHGPDYPLSHAALSDTIRQGPPVEHIWRVALVKSHTEKYAPAYTHSTLTDYIKKMVAFPELEITETILPEEMSAVHDVHAVIYKKALADAFQDTCRQVEPEVSSGMLQWIEEGKKISAGGFLDALEAQRRMCCAMEKFFEQYDIVLSLAASDVASLWTMTHLPVVCIPAFRGPDGLPFGLQIATRRYNDYKLFRFVDLLVKEICRQSEN